MKYAAMYRCPLCNRLIQSGEPQEMSYSQLPALLNAVVENQLMAGNPVLHQAPMYVFCPCADGSYGLAAFAGFKKVGR